jgi:3-deoxy-manno-octulosonate cytidylyltransferase (CMP-KDO synthetase)
MDLNGDALYFSRNLIPTNHLFVFEKLPVYKQICVIPFRHDLLQAYTTLSPTPLEQVESIDMLRLLEHGYKVRMVETDIDIHAVDTPEDLDLVETLMQNDPLLEKYIKK